MQPISFLTHTKMVAISFPYWIQIYTRNVLIQQIQHWELKDLKKCQQGLLGDIIQQGTVGSWVHPCALDKHTQAHIREESNPKPLMLKLPSSRNNLLCCWQNVEWHVVLSAGLPLASWAHGANTQSVPPPHLSVSASHSVILLLFPSP